jgi:HK97 family phage portal protein
MSLFDRFLQAFGSKASPTRALLVNSGYSMVSDPTRYDSLAREGYQRNAIAFSAINYLVTNAASVPWTLYSRKGSNLTEIEEHPLLDLLDKPNPLQGRVSLFESLYGYLKIAGNTFMEAVRPFDGQPPTELWAIRPDRMKIQPGIFGLPAAYIFKNGQGEKLYPVDPITGQSLVLHLKTWNPLNDWYGQSPIEPAAVDVDQHNEAGKFNLALLQNQARPSGVLTMEPSDKNPTGTLAPAQFARLKEEMERKYGGSSNAGRMMLLEGGLKWQQLGLTPEDMEWINGKNMNARDIVRALGCPPILLNIPGDATYSNYQEARLAFYLETILPFLDKVKHDLNNWLLPLFGDDKLILDYDRDEIQALEPLRQAKWDKAQKADFLSMNEKRRSVGYEDIDGGDTIFVPVGMVPLQFANEDPAAAPADNSGKAYQMKIWNVQGKPGRIREWKAAVRMRAGFERKLQTHFKSLFSVQKDQVVIAMKKHPGAPLAAIEDVIKREREKMGKILATHQYGIFKAFGARVLESAKSANIPEVKTSEDDFSRYLNAWIKENAFSSIDDINETTLKKLRAELAEGVAAGESIDDLADRISNAYEDFSDARSEAIAITETLSASTAASEGAARATGVVGLQKEWIAAGDEKTRHSHAKADGQVVDIDDDFELTSDDGSHVLMARPGDPKGGAGEVVNCRCTLAFRRGE